MKILPCSQLTMFDVDDTLIMWNRGKKGDPGVIEIACPTSRFTKAMEESGIFGEEMEYSVGEWTEYLVPHKKHIEQLILHKLRGHTIVVWSAGGYQWAEAAVRALKLEQYVDLVMDKPTWIYDDKKPEDFMPAPKWYVDGPLNEGKAIPHAEVLPEEGTS